MIARNDAELLKICRENNMKWKVKTVLEKM